MDKETNTFSLVISSSGDRFALFLPLCLTFVRALGLLIRAIIVGSGGGIVVAVVLVELIEFKHIFNAAQKGGHSGRTQ
jgi:hypothetical protein